MTQRPVPDLVNIGLWVVLLILVAFALSGAITSAQPPEATVDPTVGVVVTVYPTDPPATIAPMPTNIPTVSPITPDPVDPAPPAGWYDQVVQVLTGLFVVVLAFIAVSNPGSRLIVAILTVLLYGAEWLAGRTASTVDDAAVREARRRFDEWLKDYESTKTSTPTDGDHG